ncbi:alpha/beta hydrolase fold domain-containing protein [Variovorax sp. Root473]|uniref:alpha/beta hydrolase fold domain-containing protein n=1 Tax=Variovorax sp. Root473 TaxID=1736541 RepID=UPI0006F6D805|nr:alpha/beta hydrolase fold domain-containing protein [Variovorax sp. Root473]KQX87819.1 alpha/beta hydrolase [Variovorax sp. Root473]
MSPRPSSRSAEAAALAAAHGVESDLSIELPGREPVAARVYGQRPRGETVPLVLHFHGGTFICGSLDNGRNVARLLAGAGAVVVSLDYPLAPAAPFPEPVEVGYAALEWLYKQRVKLGGKGALVYLAGEEAGGNLAASVALVARDRAHPPLAGQILLSPMLDPCAGTASLRNATNDEAECRWATGWAKYLSCPSNATHPYAVPSGSLRLAALAPALVLVGPDDAMRDEAMTFAGRLRSAGIEVTSSVLTGADNWPKALYDTEAVGCASCEASVQQHFREFFSATTPPPAVPEPS